jgi:Zn-dependent protease with chaperone function
MILALGLLSSCAAMLLLGPSALTRWAPADRPLARLIAWQVLSWSVAVFAISAAALLASPSLAALGHWPAGLESCLATVDRLDDHADNRPVQAVAAGLLASALLRLGWCALGGATANHRRRSRHRVVLSLVGKPDVSLGARVVHDESAVVYCLPGRGGCVVFTSAAIEKLSAPQRAAVLAHEQAHLRGRHHLLVASANLLASAFPRVRLFTITREQTAQLVEMRADDLASRRHGRRPVAEALLALADTGRSATVLAASGVITATRIERLLAFPTSRSTSWLRRLGRVAGLVAGAAVLASSPVLLAAAGHALVCLD